MKLEIPDQLFMMLAKSEPGSNDLGDAMSHLRQIAKDKLAAIANQQGYDVRQSTVWHNKDCDLKRVSMIWLDGVPVRTWRCERHKCFAVERPVIREYTFYDGEVLTKEWPK